MRQDKVCLAAVSMGAVGITSHTTPTPEGVLRRKAENHDLHNVAGKGGGKKGRQQRTRSMVEERVLGVILQTRCKREAGQYWVESLGKCLTRVLSGRCSEKITVSKFSSYLNWFGGSSASPPASGWKAALGQTGEKSANTASPPAPPPSRW